MYERKYPYRTPSTRRSLAAASDSALHPMTSAARAGGHPPWRGPALDSTAATKRWLRRPGGGDYTGPQGQSSSWGPAWTPFSTHSPRWGGSVIALAQMHHDALAQLPSSAHTPPLRAYQETTELSRAHVWPPHSALSPAGRPLLPAPMPRARPFASSRPKVRSLLRDASQTSVLGELHDSPRSSSSPSLVPARDYVSPRPSPSTFGVGSTSAGVGRAGFWSSH